VLLRATRGTLAKLDRLMYMAAAMTGMRQGELVALRWKDVDWVARRIRVRQSHVRGVRDAEVQAIESVGPTGSGPRSSHPGRCSVSVRSRARCWRLPVVLDSSANGKLYLSPISLARFEENAGRTNTSLVRLEGHAAYGVERTAAAIRIAFQLVPVPPAGGADPTGPERALQRSRDAHQGPGGPGTGERSPAPAHRGARDPDRGCATRTRRRR
jgi:hypothetical protein